MTYDGRAREEGDSVAAGATIGEAGDQNNATYYAVDAIHLKKAGHAIVGPLVIGAIEPVP